MSEKFNKKQTKSVEEQPSDLIPALTGAEFRFIRQQAGISLGGIRRWNGNSCWAKSTISSWERQLFVKPWQTELLLFQVSPAMLKTARLNWLSSQERKEWLEQLPNDAYREYEQKNESEKRKA